MSAFVRTLWGSKRPGARFHKIWCQDIRRRLVSSESHDYYVYIYGKENYERMQKCTVTHPHVHPVLVDPSPYPGGQSDYQVEKDYRRGRKGTQDRHPWIFKVQLLRRALEDHEAIIYTDWDVFAARPEGSFELLQDRTVALSAFWYKQPRECVYRFCRSIERERRARHIAVSGNWMYLNGGGGKAFLSDVYDEMQRGKPWSWHDELTMGYLLHCKYGDRWMGDEHWLKEYESPLMVQREMYAVWPLQDDDDGKITRKTPVPFTWTRKFYQ